MSTKTRWIRDAPLLDIVKYVLSGMGALDVSKWVLLYVADYWHFLQHWWTTL